MKMSSKTFGCLERASLERASPADSAGGEDERPTKGEGRVKGEGPVDGALDVPLDVP